MCYASLHVPFRRAKAKEHLKLGLVQSHYVPLPVKAEKGPHKMVCVRTTEVLIKQVKLRADIAKQFSKNDDIRYRALAALDGKRNVKAKVNAYMQFIFDRPNLGTAFPIYAGWLQMGMRFDIGYPVVKRVRKPKAITGEKGMAVVKAAIAEQDKLSKVKAPKAKTVKAE